MAAYYQINLKKVVIINNGFFEEEKKEGMNIMTINLIYPRPGAPLVKCLRILDVNEAIQNDLDPLKPIEWKFPGDDVKDKAFSLIFKEVITGDAYLEFIVTAIKKRDEVESFLLGIIGGAAKTLLTTGIGALAANAAGSLMDSMKPGDKENIIGYAIEPLNDLDHFGDKTIELKVPKDIEIKKPKKYDSNGKITEFSKITLKKGAANVEVTIAITPKP